MLQCPSDICVHPGGLWSPIEGRRSRRGEGCDLVRDLFGLSSASSRTKSAHIGQEAERGDSREATLGIVNDLSFLETKLRGSDVCAGGDGMAKEAELPARKAGEQFSIPGPRAAETSVVSDSKKSDGERYGGEKMPRPRRKHLQGRGALEFLTYPSLAPMLPLCWARRAAARVFLWRWVWLRCRSR